MCFMRNLSKNTSKTERLDLRDINEAENRRGNKKLSIKNMRIRVTSGLSKCKES